MARPVLAAAVSGLLLWAAFPPVGWGWLALVALAPLLWALRTVRGTGGGALAGLVFGLVYFGSLLWWIRNAAWIAWMALVMAMALYATLYGAGMGLARRLPPGRWWLTAVGGWALFEYLRARVPFGGFPWGSVGYPVAELSGPRAAAQWVGASGWSVVAVGLAAGLALWATGRTRPIRWAAMPAGMAAALAMAGILWPPVADGPILRVTVVQGNTPCPLERCPGERKTMFRNHLDMTAALPADSADLVVWPESSTGFEADPVLNPERGSLISEQARRLGAYLLVGTDRPVGEEFFLNTNVLFGPDGSMVGEYAKQQPVPFGEFVPFREHLGFVPELERVPRDMLPGEGPVVFPLSEGALGSVISFEGAFARYLRQGVRAGAELMVVNTNESTFGYSAASDQLIAMTRVAAAENGVDLVHAAVSGKSALIRADGGVIDTTGLFTAEILSGELRFRKAGLTLYAWWGDWLQLLAMAGMLGGIAGKEPRWQSNTAERTT